MRKKTNKVVRRSLTLAERISVVRARVARLEKQLHQHDAKFASVANSATVR